MPAPFRDRKRANARKALDLLLAIALLILNSRSQWTGAKMKNRLLTNAFLVATILLFLVAAVFIVREL